MNVSKKSQLTKIFITITVKTKKKSITEIAQYKQITYSHCAPSTVRAAPKAGSGSWKMVLIKGFCYSKTINSLSLR